MAKQDKGGKGFDRIDSIVLGTVNAPFRRSIDAATLSECLRTRVPGEWIVQVAAFFTDVRPELVLEFAKRHGIETADLARTYRVVSDVSGERNPELEKRLPSTDDC